MSLGRHGGSRCPGLGGMEATVIHQLLSGNPPAVVGVSGIGKGIRQPKENLPLFMTALSTNG